MKKKPTSKIATNKKPINVNKKQVNINEKPINVHEGLSFIRVIYLGVFLIVLLSAVYLSFFSNDEMQFSPPSSSGMSYETASSFLSTMGQTGIDWYCGKTSSYTDRQGNVYGSIELQELKKILQNDAALAQEFCD